MIEPAAGSKDVVSFGPFSLDPRRRLLLKDGAPIVVGARTLDTLMALIARPNEAISKRELMAVVWPDVTVEEGSLRVQIAALRKALEDGKGGARYITTLAGRGFCFVAPISRVRDRGSERAAATKPALALPDKPSIAVLPFSEHERRSEQEFRRRDGRRDHTALSRIRCCSSSPAIPVHLQGPSHRRKAGRPRIWRALCPRRRVRKAGSACASRTADR